MVFKMAMAFLSLTETINIKHIFFANSMFGTPKQKYNSEKSTGMSYRHNMHVISIIERFYVL